MKKHKEEMVAERVPKVLIGKPRLYRAWLVVKDHPEVRPTTLARLVGAHPADGSRLMSQLRTVSKELHHGPFVMVPTVMDVRKRGEVLVWDKLWDLFKRHGFPHRTSLREIAALTELHRVAVGRFMRSLNSLGLIEYESLNSGEYKGIVLVSIPDHIDLDSIV